MEVTIEKDLTLFDDEFILNKLELLPIRKICLKLILKYSEKGKSHGTYHSIRIRSELSLQLAYSVCLKN